MKNIPLIVLTSLLSLFVVCSVFANDNWELTRENKYPQKIQKTINFFRTANFLKACNSEKCENSSSEWIKLWSEDEWLHPTNSNDSQDYLENCKLYELKKSVSNTKSSTIPTKVKKDWEVKKTSSYLELWTVLYKWDPFQYRESYDFVAKNPRYVEQREWSGVIIYWEADLLKNKKTWKFAILSCGLYVVPTLKTWPDGQTGE